MRKSIEELTERLAEQNDKIEAHLAYLLNEINSVRINNVVSDEKKHPLSLTGQCMSACNNYHPRLMPSWMFRP